MIFIEGLFCFNPYFSGLINLITKKDFNNQILQCFNPYFSGLINLISIFASCCISADVFQSLF